MWRIPTSLGFPAKASNCERTSGDRRSTHPITPRMKAASMASSRSHRVSSGVFRSNKLGVPCKSFQLRTDVGGPQINPSDHTKNERSVHGQFEKPSSLFRRLPGLNYHRSLKSVAL